MAKTKGTFALDLTGQQFGRWTVLTKAKQKGSFGEIYWNCLCECGSRRTVTAQSLRNGKSKSCGCYSRDRTRTHGMESTQIYNTWAQMLARCNNPNAINFHLYGGRGIRVCERWHRFEEFYADMGDRPEGCQLDRINNDGDYQPGNVRWASLREQNRNRRSTILLVWRGKQYPLPELAEMHGISRRKLAERLRKGFSLNEALKNVRFSRWNKPKRVK